MGSFLSYELRRPLADQLRYSWSHWGPLQRTDPWGHPTPALSASLTGKNKVVILNELSR